MYNIPIYNIRVYEMVQFSVIWHQLIDFNSKNEFDFHNIFLGRQLLDLFILRSVIYEYTDKYF